jgi:streptomycin 6-kinase
MAARASAYGPKNCVPSTAAPSGERVAATVRPAAAIEVRDRTVLCEPAYDLGISMREWSEELLAGDALALGKVRCALLHDLTGVDETAIWQWGFIERVSSGLYIMSLGLSDGDEFLAVADRWAESG